MACPCSPLRGSSFEFIYSVPGGPIPVGWCATHGAAVRGHVREQGRSVGGAADHWPGNLEGGESRRQAGRHTRVASAHAAQSCYAKPNTCDWRRDSCGTRMCKPPPTTRRLPSRIFGKDWKRSTARGTKEGLTIAEIDSSHLRGGSRLIAVLGPDGLTAWDGPGTLLEK